ncbi:tetratricopeptide repeat protein [Pseudomonas sp. LT1P18]|uniref:tetratricopeptide repeat protein n=1 Tax=Pseudomonas arabinosi TaxID=3398357 RepID=UPI0039EF7E88
MINSKSFLCTIIFSFIISFDSLAAPSQQQLEEKEKGIILYNQFKTLSAISHLEIAAEAGDHEAQYYLGEALRKVKRHITPEAQSAYEASALQGDIYSMIRLSGNKNDLCIVMKNCPKGRKEPAEWRKMALNAAKKEAAKGDAEAMYLLFRLTGDDKWLEQSAESGYAFAQYYLATGYRDGKGFFLLPSKRAEVVERLMKASAEGGYPLGMMGYVEVLAYKKDFETLRFWNEKAAKAGYASAVFGYGSFLSKNPSELGFPYDPVKSYALIYTLLELDGGGGLQDYANDMLPEIAAKLTPEQIEQAKQMSKEWKATHPPLSYFPDKL